MTKALSEAARALYRAAYPVGPTTASMAFTLWMKDTGLTPRDVASRINCTEMSVRAWASGRRVPTIELARRIANVCGIPIESWVEVAHTAESGAG